MRIATATAALSGIMMPPSIPREHAHAYTEMAVTLDSERHRRKHERQMNNPTYNAHGTAVEEKQESHNITVPESSAGAPIDIVA